MLGADERVHALAHRQIDQVARVPAVERGDGREVEFANPARAFDGGGVDLIEGERTIERRRGPVESFVLVLGALDGLEHALRLHDAHDLCRRCREQIDLGGAERRSRGAIAN